MCPIPFACLMWTMVGCILGSVWFAVSVLSLFAILIDPPISVFHNNIWSCYSVSVIQFLVILSPSGVLICINSDSRLSIQARKYFSVPALIVLLAFCSNILFVSTILVVICSIVLLAVRSHQLFCSHSYSYLPHFCHKESYNIPHGLPLSHFFFCGVTLSLSTVMLTKFLKCKMLCSGHSVHSFLTLSI